MSGGVDQTIRVWDAANIERPQVLAGHTGPVESVAWSPDSTRLASAGGWEDNTVRIWDLANPEEPQVLPGHSDVVRLVTWSPDGTKIASGASADGQVRGWDAATGVQLFSLEGDGMAWSPDGTLLAVGGNPTASIWQAIPTEKELTRLEGHTDRVGFVIWLPDSTRLVTGSVDNTVRLWGIPE